MCIVVDLDVVCLVCLHHSQKMHGIFQPDADSTDLQIAHKISTLSKLKVSADNETLPHKICDSCLEDLRAAWRFHKNCQTAVVVFQSILKPKHEQETVEATSSSHVAMEDEDNEKSDDKEYSQGSQLPVYKTENDINIDESIIEVPTNDSLLEDIQDTDFPNAVAPVERNNNLSSDYLDLKQSIADDDYGSVPDTIDEESELVEYYLTDDGLHDNFEETSKKPSTSKFVEKTQKSSTAGKSLLKRKISQISEEASSGNKKIQEVVLRQQERPSSSKTPSRIKVRSEFVRSQYQTSDNDEDFHLIRKDKPSPKRKLTPEPKAPKICELCGNSYRYQHALSAHMRRHFQDKPFPCELCDKAFVSNVELRRHIRVHTGHKPYACQYCDRRFSDFGSRIKHERTHTGERPYQCGTCGKSFAYPHVLSVHLRTHTGEKRFQCEFCPKGFTKKAYLISHTNQHHAEQESKVPLTISELSIDGSISDDGRDGTEYQVVNKLKIDNCLYSTEYVSEGCDAGSQAGNEDNVQYHDGIGVEDSDTTMLIHDQMHTKQENLDDDDEAIEEGDEVVEVHIDDYTIRVR